MGLFSRSKREPEARDIAQPNPNDWIGRKFRSGQSPEASAAHFEAVVREVYGQGSGPLRRAAWRTPPGAAAFQSSQLVKDPVEQPAVTYRMRVAGHQHVELAVFERDAGCELWMCYPGFDLRAPTPLAGTWKMRDGSLSSIGMVEKPLWGLHAQP